MGYAVQVDPEVLAAGARRLVTTAQTLDTLAGRVLALCTGADVSGDGGELSAALDGTGRAAARAIGQTASVLGDLGARTGQAGEHYRSLEKALTSRFHVGGVSTPELPAGTREGEGAT